MFGIFYPKAVNIFEIITGYIDGFSKECNVFWFMLSSNVLWQLWRRRNQERFDNYPKHLTKFSKKLFLLNTSSQVMITMFLEKDKLRRFLRNGHATMFFYEMKMATSG